MIRDKLSSLLLPKIYIYTCTVQQAQGNAQNTNVITLNLRKERHNSKFGIFELLE
jgi:hypothetical protein